MAGGLPTGGQGSKFMCCVRNPRNINIFVRVPGREDIGYPAGRIGDRGDREIVYVPNVYVPFPAPMKIPGGGGGPPRKEGGGGARGLEGVCGEFWGGAGAKYFFSAPKLPPRC